MACNWTLLEHISATAFCQWRKGCGLRGKTVNDYLAALSGFGDWLTLKRMIRENPFEVVARVETHKEDREYRAKYSPEQLMALLAVSPQPRKVIYQLIAETGGRRADIKGVRWGDFDLLHEGGAGMPATELARPGEREPVACGVPSDGPSVKFRASIAKNGKTRIFPLTPGVAAQLRALKPADAAPFQCPFAHSVPRVSTLRRDLARAGIPFLDMGRRRDLHPLRKTFGSALIANGESIYVVAHAMRHSDIRLTLKMYCDSQQFEQPLAEAISRLPWDALNHKVASVGAVANVGNIGHRR
jgi:integrase